MEGGAGADETIGCEGGWCGVTLRASHRSSGTVRVEGDAGVHTGAGMTGGEVIVTGNVGDWLGAEMHGGKIDVHGNAGHLVAAVYRGGIKGMTAGEILIDGNAGNEIGHSMRRGLIAVGGRAGDFAGVNMIAGTIFIGCETGNRYGAGMSRGSIVLLGADSPDMLPTFRFACTYRPTFLSIYLRHLSAARWPVPPGSLESAYRRFLGDFLELGKGEILTRVAAE